MKKIISFICAILIACGLCFAVMGCYNPWSNLSRVSNTIEDIEFARYFLSVGETETLDIDELTKNCTVEYKDWYLEVKGDSVLVTGNTITAVSAGNNVLWLNMTDGTTHYYDEIALIIVIDEEDCIPVSTSDELYAIRNNLNGNYILTADIDLKNYNWEPIGTYDYEFKGTFINPDGYVIRNLTMKERIGFGVNSYYFGLFGVTSGAYFNGIRLENVDIEIAPFAESCYMGGLVALNDLYESNFIECSVAGNIIGQGYVGGIIGYNAYGYYNKCSFNGTLSSSSNHSYDGSDKEFYGNDIAGGIIGYNYDEMRYGRAVINCSVEADISAECIAGGIVGYCRHDVYPHECIFNGELNAPVTGELYGDSFYN